ncbi:MAG: glycosyltransferase [Desulfobacteraceae bacterium]|jgi:glycosyltransferase involved in cell wall biosynthesis|nr:glycosyltransferase [Desulfobacteraceae bacterium]
MKLSVVIPGLNIEATIEKIINEINQSGYVTEIIVVDNNSIDNTFEVSKKCGAKVVKCKEQGLGYAMKAGILATTNDLVIKIDGDIINPKLEWIETLISFIGDNVVFVNGIYQSNYDEFPVGNLVAKPAIKLKLPELSYIKMPLSGTYMFKKDLFNYSKLPNNWAFDVAMAIEGHNISGKISQVEIGELNDKPKRIAEYSDMAFELLEYIINLDNING